MMDKRTWLVCSYDVLLVLCSYCNQLPVKALYWTTASTVADYVLSGTPVTHVHTQDALYVETHCQGCQCSSWLVLLLGLC
ncbi:hypothetical protein CEXT_431471 [Caerostris extrusa]|uniref:Secreted protein n=1 Tax=Caerostris extrusa TaxID=172846 RepID=A0AAV4XHD2_CAEEX|nr:hypothetical protein CEXT_431471 [Caerostris extrusa]